MKLFLVYFFAVIVYAVGLYAVYACKDLTASKSEKRFWWVVSMVLIFIPALQFWITLLKDHLK